MDNRDTVAAIDVGSNSIKVLVARRGQSSAAIETVCTKTIETRISQGISHDNPKLTEAQKERIRTATNINSSDIDFCEFNGQLIINYMWGDQVGTEHIAEAVYKGTMKQFLKGWFPEE